MDKLRLYIDAVENRLFDIFPAEKSPQDRVAEAAKYSLSAGGKRIRPVLTLAFCEMCGADHMCAVDAACAVEYMHTFSLIHDDLPCMDNDDFRRGKPSCHVQFGEATALLAGDLLAVLPFEMIARSETIPPDTAVKCVRELAYQCGMFGMIGGQQIDTRYTGEGNALPDGLILPMYDMKTSALLKAACRCGVYCARSSDEKSYLAAAGEYADNLGRAFQIIDDILDVTGNTESLGKSAGSDAANDKNTFVRAFGMDKARAAAEEYTSKAVDALSVFGSCDFVAQLTLMLLGRNK